MALNQVTFNKGQGGLGRPLQGEDFISGMLFYRDSLPSGFSSSDRVKQIFSLEEAEDLGITEDGTDTAIMWYHIREFFKQNDRAQLWVGIYATETTYDYSQVKTIQSEAEGKIRQMGVFQDDIAYADGDVDTLDGIADDLFSDFQPLHIIFTPDISAETDLSTLADLRAKDAKYVSVDIGQDGGQDGSDLFASESVSIGSMGALLGAISRASVEESIAWVDKFKINDGGEFETLAFGNGDSYKDKTLAELDAIDALGYIFLRKFVGIDGSYYNDSHTATTETSDFAYIENNRTIDKAVREIRTLLLPTLNGKIFLNADGTLQEDSIQYYRSKAVRALDNMQRNGEISQYAVKIDPSQDVLATSKIVVTADIVPVGVARSIEVNIGFQTSIS